MNKKKSVKRLLAVVLASTMMMAMGMVAMAANPATSSPVMVGSVRVVAEIGYGTFSAFGQVTASDYVDSYYYLNVDTGGGTKYLSGEAHEYTYYQLYGSYDYVVSRVWGDIKVDSPDGSHGFYLDTK